MRVEHEFLFFFCTVAKNAHEHKQHKLIVYGSINMVILHRLTEVKADVFISE